MADENRTVLSRGVPLRQQTRGSGDRIVDGREEEWEHPDTDGWNCRSQMDVHEEAEITIRDDVGTVSGSRDDGEQQ